jgi:ABC-2 type transport system ATP-binding protein
MPRTARSFAPEREAPGAAGGTSSTYRQVVAAIVSVRGLAKSYGSLKAVAGISFDVAQGEIFALLGPNGAGKTSTVEILEGLRRADGGTAVVAGVDVTKDPAGVKERIGVQLQSSAFPENFLAREIVELFALFYRRKVDAMALLRAVGLEDKAKQKSEKLSGGQRQRLSIAVAMVNEPQVLFLDEPTTGLDPQARRNLWELIRDIRKRGTTVFLTTHYLDEAEVLCDRVAIMDGGRIIAQDTPRALIESLLARGFSKPLIQQQANLEDVFLDVTGHALREE